MATSTDRSRSIRSFSRSCAPLLGAAALLASCSGGGDGSGGGGAAPSTPLAPDFQVRKDVILSTGGLGDALAVDLNLDGVLDLVESNFFEQTVTVGMGNGDGTFTTVSVLDTPGFPAKLAAGDLDGDGLPDLGVAVLELVEGTPLACATCTGPSLLVLQQDASGFFDVAATLELTGPPFDLAAAPIQGLARDELLVTLPDARESWVVELTAPGVLTVIETILSEPDGGQPLTVATLDENQDGLMDVVVGERAPVGAPDRVVVFRGTGANGSIGHQYDRVIAPTASWPIVRNVGDVDGDGHQDLGVAQFDGNTAWLMPGAPGGLATQVTIDFGAPQSGLVFADLDGDGDCEAAATLIHQGTIHVLDGTGPRQFDGAPAWYNVGSLPRSLAAPDFFANGYPDLFCANVSDVSIAFAKGGGEFRAAHGTLLGETPTFMGTGDLDGDGDVDVVCIDVHQKQLVFLESTGDGHLVNAGELPLQPTQSPTQGYIAVRDFDEDGDLDVVTTLFETGDIQFFANPGGLPFTTSDPNDRVAVGNEPTGLHAGDVDGDGHLDLAVANSADKTVQLLLGQGDGSFVPQAPIAVPYRPLAMRLEDLDADGDLDLAFSSGQLDGTGSRISFMEGDGAGGLTLVSSIDLIDICLTIDAADMDGNGFVDLALGQSTLDVSEVFVISNAGGFAFTAQTIPVGPNPSSVVIRDVDADGALDLIVPTGAGDLRLVMGDGAGGFTDTLPLLPGDLPVPFGTMAAAVEDLDGDGLGDLIMISNETPLIWVALNSSVPLAE